jgi:hypothetical protein
MCTDDLLEGCTGVYLDLTDDLGVDDDDEVRAVSGGRC